MSFGTAISLTSDKWVTDMADVNIITENGRLGALLTLECERLGLSSIITKAPEKSARIYICDTGAKLPDEKTLFIGIEGTHSLNKSFLLTDLRREMLAILTLSAEKPAVPRKRQRRITLSLNPDEYSVSVRGREPVRLSPTEYKLLDALNSRRGEVLTYAEAEKIIGGEGSNKANVYIYFLRKKLEADGEKIIFSIRGKGFMIK